MKQKSDMLVAMSMDMSFSSTIGRVRNLVTLYGKVAGSGGGRKPVDATDLLRSAVVLLHATFEQALREVARHRLPDATAKVLDTVPLKGLSPSGRAEKFMLGSLLPHKGKLVENVIRESVEEYLAHFTINNTTDLINLLNAIEVPTAPVQSHLALLAEMLSRRHNIVHRADSNETRGRGHYQARSLGQSKVSEWIDNVEAAVRAIAREVAYPSSK